MIYLDKEYLIIHDGNFVELTSLQDWIKEKDFFPVPVFVNSDLEPLKLEILLEHTDLPELPSPSMLELMDDCCPEPKLTCTGLNEIREHLNLFKQSSEQG